MGILGKIGGAVSATTAAIQAHHQKVQAKKAANKQAKQQQAQPQQTQPSGSGGSNFGPKILVQLNQHKSKLIWVILILAAIFAGLVAWLGWAPVKSFLWKYVFKILVGIVGLVVLGIAFKNDDDKLTKRMVLIPYIIWLFLDINNFLGGPYQGFKFELSILAQTNWPAVLTSSLVSAALFYKMFDEFFNRDLMFVFSMIGLIAINYSAAKLLPQLNDTLPSWLIPVLFVLLAAIIILAYFKFRNSYTFNPDSIGYTIMVFVFSFYWINWSWTANFKAVIHVVWILVFCLGYLSFIPDAKKGQLYLFTSLFLIADFFFYQFEIAPGLKFPLIVIISSFIGYRFTKSIFALTNMWMILMLVWALWFTPVAVAQGVTLEEKTPEGPTGIVPTIKTWLSAFERKISGTVGERIDIATGGYSGLVEQNQYESLGVYFADPRAGEPKF
ncbi:hypothetical protein HYX06_03410, partial [Candidatus Woesearchaeota archaeon]|nr:hypothetical protein [Candidatus Woesearchaeota archaeon]